MRETYRHHLKALFTNGMCGQRPKGLVSVWALGDLAPQFQRQDAKEIVTIEVRDRYRRGLPGDQ
jgi:hypothetical protein